MSHRAGFVNIIGNPNVGKSTLMNALLGEKLSIITAKAQTTRHRIKGILSTEEYQIVFSDTPGRIEPAYDLQKKMMVAANSAFEDADILLYIIEAGTKKFDDELIGNLQKADVPLKVVINKIDNFQQDEIAQMISDLNQILPTAEIIPASALHKFNVDTILKSLVSALPESPPYYPKEDITDRSQRFIASEMIREKILERYAKEIPYSSEVQVEAFKDEPKILKISAVIYVERDSQKAILIGKQGAAIKQLGISSRQRMELFFGKKIHLELFVKVQKDWRTNERDLKNFGYDNV